MWTIGREDGIDRQFKEFKKKWAHEMSNVVTNIDQLMTALEHGTRPEQLKKLGFIHTEPMGVIAVDQSGKGKGSKMKEFRAYLYPDEEDHNLQWIRLGDKASQSDDVAHCTRFVRNHLRQKQEIRGQAPAG